eukprot:TRINITY_DN13918_c0_g1_i1.p1 TRINITY_DN13918_c0_g1~~TRINITY_DN13918_c0_g1_i1.p1  ORF type:complete len:146 (+),score=22.09 TRINITY_DN13918_c0_g1_i1:191-628(+)
MPQKCIVCICFRHSTDSCPKKKKITQIWKPIHTNSFSSLEAFSDQRVVTNPGRKESSTCKGLSTLPASPSAEGTGSVSYSVSHGTASGFIPLVKGEGRENLKKESNPLIHWTREIFSPLFLVFLKAVAGRRGPLKTSQQHIWSYK